jgi:hypothetical protein
VQVRCQIVYSDCGYEGVIQEAQTGKTVYNTGFVGCAEDADGFMECTILRNGWEVLPGGVPVSTGGHSS